MKHRAHSSGKPVTSDSFLRHLGIVDIPGFRPVIYHSRSMSWPPPTSEVAMASDDLSPDDEEALVADPRTGIAAVVGSGTFVLAGAAIGAAVALAALPVPSFGMASCSGSCSSCPPASLGPWRVSVWVRGWVPARGVPTVPAVGRIGTHSTVRTLSLFPLECRKTAPSTFRTRPGGIAWWCRRSRGTGTKRRGLLSGPTLRSPCLTFPRW